MLAKSRAYSQVNFVPIAEQSRHESLWQRIVHSLVMDGPERWDMHPDVQRLIDQERSSRC